MVKQAQLNKAMARRAAGCVFAAWLLAAVPALAAPPLRVLQPRAGQVVHSNSGDIDVQVAGVPRGAALRPLLDGRPAGGPHAAARFQLHGVPRGAHRLVVVAVDASGADVARSAPVQFQVWHASRQLRHGR